MALRGRRVLFGLLIGWFGFASTQEIGPYDVMDDSGPARNSAAAIAQGITEAFLKERVSVAERSCIAANAGKMAEDVTDVSKQSASRLSMLYGNIQELDRLSGVSPMQVPPRPDGPRSAASAAPGVPANMPTLSPALRKKLSPALRKNKQVLESVPDPVMEQTVIAANTVETARLTVTELSHTLRNMFSLEERLTAECLSSGEATKAFALAKEHFEDLTYVRRQIVGHGVDIIDQLSDAVAAYDEDRLKTFGAKIGDVSRSVLLGGSEEPESQLAVQLEEVLEALHDPIGTVQHLGQDVLEDILHGFVQSLFGPDFKMQLTMQPGVEAPGPLASPWQKGQVPGTWGTVEMQISDKTGSGNASDLVAEESSKPTNPAPPTTVDVDLHQCIDGNVELFQKALAPIVGVAEQFMAGKCAGDVASLCMTLWTVVLRDMQEALQTCGFEPEQQQILLRTMWSGDLIHAQLSLPSDQVQAEDVTYTMAHAVGDWRAQRYTRFGEQLGDLAREMVVVSFPQLYSKDDSGRLRRKLAPSRFSPNGLMVAISLLMSLAALSAIAVRSSRRSLFNRDSEVLDRNDAEDVEQLFLE